MILLSGKKIVSYKYNSSPNIFCCPEISASPFWKGVLWAYKAAQVGIRWKIGDDKTVKFWEDWWFGNCSLATQFWYLYIIADQKMYVWLMFGMVLSYKSPLGEE